MIRSYVPFAGALTLSLLVGCASYPQPNQHLADAEGAYRSAAEQGAANNPQASLHLKMAQEGIQKAKAQIADNDNQEADSTLLRAKADGELALAEMRADQSKKAAQAALDQVAQLQGRRMPSGAASTTTIATQNANGGTTTTTSATVETKTNNGGSK
ncbi:MAG: DUF4398 domain-containing protein [Polyangiaceae bacterium]